MLKNDFDRVFYVLSLFFVTYFFLVPLLFLQLKPTTEFLNLSLNDPIRIYQACWLFIVFCLGFFVYDLLVKLFPSGLNINRSFIRAEKLNNLFFIFCFLFFLFFIYQYINLSERQEELYAIRKGEVKGSHLYFLFGILSGVIKLVLVYLLIKSDKKVLTITFLLCALYIDFMSSIGRTSLLVWVSIVFLYFSKMKAIRYAWFCLFAFALFLPLIITLKSIIYIISANKGLDLNDFLLLDFDYNSYMNNFGHPLVSLLYADKLVDNIGFRFFYDYVQGFLFYLKPFGVDAGDSITYYNTEVLMGTKQSIIPTGFLAFGYVQLHFIGVFISGIFYRLMGVIGKKVYYRVGNNNEAIKFSLCFFSANTFYHGDIRVMVLSFFLPMLGVYMLHNYFIETVTYEKL